MKKIFLTALFNLSYFILIAQVPQGFNYQAVAHSSTGAPIMNTTLQVKAGILSDTLAPVIIWEELHSSVKTNAYGVFSLVIGSGTRQSGSALSFNDIVWTKTPLFIRIQVNYQGSWKSLGSAKLWTVPYAMVAKDLSGSVKKLAVAGETNNMEEALFEVKNKDGQTIFAVYNEGVRIYVDDGEKKSPKGGFSVGGFGSEKGISQPLFFVNPDSIRAYIYDDPLTKTPKGGFSVGGFDALKGPTNKYMVVTPDSVRIYIDKTPSTKSPKGGFSVGGFDQMKGENVNYLDVSTDATGIINPSQNRILWYPLKNAFLAGRVVVQKPDSVGENSFASGYESMATGKYSQAMGYKVIARGDYSTAIGKNAVAALNSSFAFGENSKALNNQTYSFGNNSRATGLGSTAFGYSAKASGQDAYAFGSGTEAAGLGSFALGFIGRDSAGVSTGNTKAISENAVALGSGAQALGKGSYSIGTSTIANKDFSIAMGYKAKVSGYGSASIGYLSNSSGSYSLALGYNSVSTKLRGVSINGGYATGEYAIALGPSKASDNGSISIGGYVFSYTILGATLFNPYYTNASGKTSTAIGQGIEALGNNSIIIGTGQNRAINNKDLGEARADFSMCFGHDVVSTGQYATAMGFSTEAQSFKSFVIGTNNVIAGSQTSWNSTDPLFVVGNGTSPSEPSNALILLKNGSLGLNITSPYAKLHIKNDNLGTAPGSQKIWFQSEGLSANKDILEVAHNRIAYGTNWETAEIKIQKIVDVTRQHYISFTGYSDYTSNLEMGYGNTPQMIITQAGNVGINLATPSQINYTLEVNGSAGKLGGGTWTTSSDLRLKDIHGLYSRGIKEIMELKSIRFNYKKSNLRHLESDHEYIGFVAQDVKNVFPEAVTEGKDGYLDFDMHPINVAVVNALQEEHREIESLKAENQALKEQVKDLLKKMDQIEILLAKNASEN